LSVDLALRCVFVYHGYNLYECWPRRWRRCERARASTSSRRWFVPAFGGRAVRFTIRCWCAQVVYELRYVECVQKSGTRFATGAKVRRTVLLVCLPLLLTKLTLALCRGSCAGMRVPSSSC
jgi:hypothetical protein